MRRRRASSVAAAACWAAAVAATASVWCTAGAAAAAAPHAFDPGRDSYAEQIRVVHGHPVIAYAMQRSGSNLWLMLLNEAYGVKNYVGAQPPHARQLQCRGDENTPLWKHFRPFDDAGLAGSGGVARPVAPTAAAMRGLLQADMCEHGAGFYRLCEGERWGSEPTVLVIEKALGPWLVSTRVRCPNCIAMDAAQPCSNSIPSEASRESLWRRFYTFWGTVATSARGAPEGEGLRVVRVTYESLLYSPEGCADAVERAYEAITSAAPKSGAAMRVCRQLHGGGMNVPRSGTRSMDAVRNIDIGGGWKRSFSRARAEEILHREGEVNSTWPI